jgi:hypothetical protein
MSFKRTDHSIHVTTLKERKTRNFVIPRGCDFIDFPPEAIEFETNLSSRLSRRAVEPERSAVEGPAVSFLSIRSDGP